MAFCIYCGTRLKEGVKFCPKCGHPNNGVQEGIEEEVERESFWSKLYHYNLDDKYYKYYKWFIVCLAIAVYFGIKSCDSCSNSSKYYNVEKINDSNSISEDNYKEEQQNKEQKEKEERIARERQEKENSQRKLKEIEEEAYKTGYRIGFGTGPASHMTDDPKVQARQLYSMYYDAPMTEEDKKLCNKYVENFVKGYEAGYAAQY